ncbi:type III secretion system export apparatus subunit SctT [Aquincola sp. J276]|uniref:type III secretion system export apparatus subunit SctT n=1 Tax=Aquincola sp. J276 TaxID=2898432 RepID=UPI0021513CB9|nr:type III secretion system export apparatus subunit SctT [Aquincola sp. J276]MCR5867133.1 type III secretion system export apparatus subunit SctT [Aquincola sp. J276]
MGPFEAIGPLGDAALLVGLASTRIAVAFLLLPVLAPDTVPALVRNAIFLSLGTLTLALQPTVALGSFGAWQWLLLFGREAVLGLALGFGLAAFLWAFEAAGQIVDTKVAVGNGQLMDPMSGQQVSVTGALLGRLAGFLFMFGGGFMLFIGVLLESFRAWPLAQPGLVPRLQGLSVFEGYLHELMALAFLLAAPALVVMFAVDLALGLVNRFAPQLNVIALSMSLKALAATAIWLLLLGTLVQGFADELARRIAAVLPTLARLFVTP